MKFVKFLLIFLITVICSSSKLKKTKSQIHLNTTHSHFYTKNYYDNFSNKIFEISLEEECDTEICNDFLAKCTDKFTCKCLFGYANFNRNDCAYKLKSQLVAFSLEIFTLIGGNIYLEFYSYVFLKGVLFLIMLILIGVEIPFNGFRGLLDYKCVPCVWFKTGLFVMSIFTLVAWQMYDLIILMSHNAIDNNLMPLLIYF